MEEIIYVVRLESTKIYKIRIKSLEKISWVPHVEKFKINVMPSTFEFVSLMKENTIINNPGILFKNEMKRLD